jgi:ectoine hydroxylase-related dioxygenase (phytanoyl-CoA dioxygenase family)
VGLTRDGRDELRERGFVVLRGLLGADEVEHAVRRLEALSGRTRASFAVSDGRAARGGLVGAWTRPDGVSQERAFWPLATKPALVAEVRRLLGDGVCYLQHSDLHVGFSAVTWHRDCVNRRFGVGPDWDEGAEPYRILRVGIYLQSFAESRFALRLVPGSHRAEPPSPATRRRERRYGLVAQAVSLLTGDDFLPEHATAVTTEPGDAILFDPRLLHAGSPIGGPKYSVFLAYGVPGAHFARHAAYYRHGRAELGYRDLEPELVARLRSAGLYADLPGRGPIGSGSAYRPSLLQRLLGRHIRPARPA